MPYIVYFLSWVFFLFFQTTSIYGGDAGDLVTSAYLHGVAHPPGFPLYTLLGFILSKLPFFTVAWRVGLISSAASAGTLTVLFLLIRDITKSSKTALLTICILATTYLFWLYASVPEVFALHSFFCTALVYELYKWKTTRQDRYLSIFCLTLGLSLSHHLLTIFLFPSFIFIFIRTRNKLPKMTRKFILKKGALFVLGLTPYLYIFAAAASIPAISWDNAYTIPHFFNLVLRKTYGTFQSGPVFGQNFLSRLIQLPYMVEFMRIDFTLVGLTLAGIGFVAQWKKRRELWTFFLLVFLFIGPLYFFYASYYIIDRFSLATFERFLLPSYIIIAVWIGEGILAVYKLLARFVTQFTHKKRDYQILFSVFFIIPLLLFFINYPKISILKNDRTAENHAHDILLTAPKNAIVILQYDSTLFDTQYVYYTQRIRPDIKLLHYFKLYNGQLGDQMKKYYPEVSMPQAPTAGKGPKFMDAFIRQNYKKFPIYINNPIPLNVKNVYWVRLGLLFRLYSQADLPQPTDILKENERLWAHYSDPQSGSLGKYNNLMLSNILDFYKDARLELGELYEEASQFDKALIQYNHAHVLLPDTDVPLYRMGIVYAKMGECKKSKANLEDAIDIAPAKEEYYYSLSQLYKHCFKDEKKAAAYEKLYQEKKSANQTPVEKL